MRLFLLAAIVLPLLPRQPKDLNRERDADGFGNIKWGMSVAEAKAAFPGLREPERLELTSGAFEERLIQPVHGICSRAGAAASGAVPSRRS